MSPRPPERHAAARLVQRYDGSVDMHSLQQLIRLGEFEYVRRQSGTRSLCKAVLGPTSVWFIINRVRRTLITVLSPEMAEEQMTW
jgi:hypothetical protein